MELDPLRGRKERLEGTVYHASADGRWLISANMTTVGVTPPGYGVQVPDEAVPRNIGPVEDDGFYLTDTATGRVRLLISIAEAIRRANPPVRISEPERQEIYGFHSKFNPQGDRGMLSLRWFPTTELRPFNIFKIGHDAMRFAWIVMGLDDGPVHCAIGPEKLEKGGYHATWFPDGHCISLNLNIDRVELRFVQFNADGSNLRKMLDATTDSGHPTVVPDGRHLLTDAYENEKAAFADGSVPLRWVDPTTGEEQTIARIPVRQPCPDRALRLDPHPAWDHSGRYVVFNGLVGGTRRVFVADIQSLLT